MTYIRTSVGKPAGSSPAAAAPKDPNVVIIAIDDILFFPPRDSKGVKHLGSFVLKPGSKMITIYSTSSKISASVESDGDEDAVSLKHTFECQHPGNELEIKEFIQNWIGVNCLVIHGSCRDSFREVLGTKCAPLQLKPTKQDNNEGRFYNLVFEQFNPTTFVPGHYEGDLVFAEPTVVADVTDVDVTPANGYQYKLPALNATEAIEFGDMTIEHGDIVTLIGGGGSDPATLSSGTAGSVTVALKSGTTWTALDGAVINLQLFSAGATKYLIEMSRQ